MKKGILVLGLMIAAVGMFFQGKGMERAVETVGELSNREHPKVALTFDDGPHMVYTEMLGSLTVEYQKKYSQVA